MKELKTRWMYWRFRNITRNRLRLKSWWGRRRQLSSTTYRGRGTASYVYHRSPRRTWFALGGMILALTALSSVVHRYYVNPGIVYLIGSLVVIGTVYWALRQL